MSVPTTPPPPPPPPVSGDLPVRFGAEDMGRFSVDVRRGGRLAMYSCMALLAGILVWMTRDWTWVIAMGVLALVAVEGTMALHYVLAGPAGLIFNPDGNVRVGKRWIPRSRIVRFTTVPARGPGTAQLAAQLDDGEVVVAGAEFFADLAVPSQARHLAELEQRCNRLLAGLERRPVPGLSPALAAVAAADAEAAEAGQEPIGIDWKAMATYVVPGLLIAALLLSVVHPLVAMSVAAGIAAALRGWLSPVDERIERHLRDQAEPGDDAED